MMADATKLRKASEALQQLTQRDIDAVKDLFAEDAPVVLKQVVEAVAISLEAVSIEERHQEYDYWPASWDTMCKPHFLRMLVTTAEKQLGLKSKIVHALEVKIVVCAIENRII